MNVSMPIFDTFSTILMVFKWQKKLHKYHYIKTFKCFLMYRLATSHVVKESINSRTKSNLCNFEQFHHITTFSFELNQILFLQTLLCSFDFLDGPH